MRKIITIFVLLFSAITTIHAQNTAIAKLTKGSKLTDLIESPDGKWIAFVKQSNYIVPDDCFYFFSKGDHADEIWIVNKEKMTKKLLVAPRFNCKDMSKVILDPHNLHFSTDSKTLYFETSAWVTTGAVHAIDTKGKHPRFIIDGSELHVVRSGPYKDNLIVNQHRYRFKDATPLGSYNQDWLFTTAGKRIKPCSKEVD